MKRVVLATKNRGKIKEIEEILSGLPLEIVPLDAYPAMPDIEEDGESFFANALKKAKAIAEYTKEAAVADDSGLTVDALNGRPGIYSARYAGAEATDEDNIRKLLNDLRGISAKDRQASFRCTIVLYEPDGRYHAFEGRWNGLIGETPQGTAGFGYDPVFYVPEMGLTAAEMAPGEKNRRSHRAQALEKLKIYLMRKS
ncbi:MAG: XTP/dITP diphosphatase [Syntrophales bacterium]|nr:XTP/dITP diphosphatase [Syntrophales bacterium]